MISLLDQIVSAAAKRWPDNEAVREADTGRGVTYKQLDKRINALSAWLSDRGLKKGERVGLLRRNSGAAIAAFFSISRAGGIAVPFNYDLDTQDIARQANDCGLSALYAAREFADKARRIRAKVKSIRFVVGDSGQVTVTFGDSHLSNRNRAAFGDSHLASQKVSVTEKDPALIIYTSGTTARPSGVTLSHKNLICNNRAIVKYAGISNRDSVCCVLPLHYIYGLSLVLSHFLAGSAVVLENRFMYPNVVLDTMAAYRVTAFAGVSSHYVILLHKSDLAARRFPALRYFMQAGDAMPVNITRGLIRLFPKKKLYMMYGLTEAAPRVTYLDPRLVAQKPASVGRPVKGVEVRVAAENGGECRPNETGQIIVRGENVMLGYWNNKKNTGRTIRNGWLYTGDLGYKDEDKDLFITGRKDKVIKDSKILKQVPKGMLGKIDTRIITNKDRIDTNKFREIR